MCRARGRTPTAPEGGRDPRDAMAQASFGSHTRWTSWANPVDLSNLFPKIFFAPSGKKLVLIKL
jgi:hypothetical protein